MVFVTIHVTIVLAAVTVLSRVNRRKSSDYVTILVTIVFTIYGRNHLALLESHR